MQRMIKTTGQLVTITKIHKGLGTFDGEQCDLMEYKDENNVKCLIERPKLDNC